MISRKLHEKELTAQKCFITEINAFLSNKKDENKKKNPQRLTLESL